MKTEPSVTIISACTARKQDAIPIPQRAKTVQPEDYLDDENLIKKLLQTRQKILVDPRAQVGNKLTYAFDLYVNTGHAYKEIRTSHYKNIKILLKSGKIEWFFLSGGYGIINALEPANRYQATFSKSIAYKRKIPYTAKMWGENLTRICDDMIKKQNPKDVYIFGSQDYTCFIKRSNFWQHSREGREIRMFESTGSAGPHWISKILGELAQAIEKDRNDLFYNKYPGFVKQGKEAGLNGETSSDMVRNS